MPTMIDASGRLVIPKPIRDRLGLHDGVEVEIEEHDGVIEIRPRPAAVEIEDTPDGPVLVPQEAVPTLTAEQVRTTLEHVRR